METEFLNWLSNELKQRSWSYRELARRAGLSQSLMSRTLTGKRDVDLDFCVSVANALEEPPEKLFRLAGILPSQSENDPTLSEIQEIVKNLSPQRRDEVLRYIRFLYKNEQD